MNVCAAASASSNWKHGFPNGSRKFGTSVNSQSPRASSFHIDPTAVRLSKKHRPLPGREYYRDRIAIRYAGTWEGGLRAKSAAGALPITVLSLSARHRLVLLSIDGLDQRYLRDCDKLRLRIPNL